MTESRSIRMHYSGGLTLPGKGGSKRVIMSGYAACVTGQRTISLKMDGRTTDDASAVTCKVCRSLMAHQAALIEREAVSPVTPTPEISARVQARIEDHFDTLRVCQDTVDRAREDDELTDTPGCSELLAWLAVRDDAAASSAWLTRMKAEALRLGMRAEFLKLEADYCTTPNYTIRLSDAAKTKRDVR